MLSLNEFVRLSKGSTSSGSYCGDEVVFNSGFPRFGGGLLTSMTVMGANGEDGGIHDVGGGGIVVFTKSGSGGRGSSGGGGGACDSNEGNGSAKLNCSDGHIESDGGCRKGPGTAVARRVG